MGYDRNDCWMTCGERDDKGDPWEEIERLRTALQAMLDATSYPFEGHKLMPARNIALAALNNQQTTGEK